jgi:hypothetical protein
MRVGRGSEDGLSVLPDRGRLLRVVRRLATHIAHPYGLESQPVLNTALPHRLHPCSARALLEQIASFSRPYFQLRILSLLAP